VYVDKALEPAKDGQGRSYGGTTVYADELMTLHLGLAIISVSEAVPCVGLCVRDVVEYWFAKPQEAELRALIASEKPDAENAYESRKVFAYKLLFSQLDVHTLLEFLAKAEENGVRKGWAKLQDQLNALLHYPYVA
jgi:hypothetical protein